MTISTRHSSGGDASSLYLHARSEWNRRTPASIRTAIRYLEKAISMDGAFPLACAALADCYSILLDYGVIAPREGLTQARLASGRALHRGPNLVESLTSAALVRQMDLDWEGAEAEFRAAIQAHPGYSTARQRYALFLAWMGRPRQARGEIDVALTLDAHSPAVAASSAWIEYYGGRHTEAVRQARRVLEHHPGFASAQVVLGSALVQDGEAALAAEVLEDAASESQDNVSVLAILAYALGRSGMPREAERTLRTLGERRGAGYVSPYYVAVGLMGLGREEESMENLARAEGERSPQLVHLLTERIFDPLRGHPEFVALVDRLRFKKGAGTSAEPRVEVA